LAPWIARRIVPGVVGASWPSASFLQSRIAHALGDAAIRLTTEDHRIDRTPDIIENGVSLKRHTPVSTSISISAT
jgi:hypothetical protein